MRELERRCFQAREMRVEGEGESRKIVGYAAVFDVMSEGLPGFQEVIAPGAFGKSLAAGADVRALVDHDPGRILGRNTAGTLDVREDDKGLAVEIDPPDTTAGRDIVTSIERGDVTGMSFAFRTIEDKWETKEGGDVRTLIEVELHDVSVVAFPAYPDAVVALRSLDEWKKASAAEEGPDYVDRPRRLRNQEARNRTSSRKAEAVA